MENHSTNSDLTRILQPKSPARTVIPRSPRPLWLSTAGYFLIALAASLGLFFVVWGLLHDEGDRDAPWLPAGIAASVMMGLAIVAREVVLRRARTRYLLKHDKLGHPIAQPTRQKKGEKKFTLEQNAAALRLIKRKADEANTALATAEKQLEVFKACQEYLEIVEAELQKVQVGSPRLPALRNGQETVKILHKRFLMQWAAEETRRLTREATVLVSIDEKIETAQRAVEALNFALQFYPNEPQLHDSLAAVKEFITSIRVSHWIELAERAAFKGHFRKAIDYYQDALFYLSREPLAQRERDLMTAKLNNEIEHLRSVSGRKKSGRKSLPKN